ncbi:MAG: glycosyltransferase family 2 protein [Kiritimatiellaeota bacterium]|nr:glycosyltransferase family 2 protein [Kiritimatiellota bacterium]
MKRYCLVFINWNTPDLTLQAVHSARAAAADPAALRTIIVDNGSSDDSVSRFREELPGVQVLALSSNQGYAGAANRGLDQVAEPFAFLLNTDLLFRNDVFSLLAAALESDPTAVVATPRLLREDGSEQAAVVPEPRLFWELTNRSLPRRFIRLHSRRPTPVPSIVGPCMGVHMERVRRVGYLDERFFFFFEETDWCRRIRQAGLRILFVPEGEVVHLQGRSANRRPVRARIQFFESRYRYFRKHGGARAERALVAGLRLRLGLDLLLHGCLSVFNRRSRDRLAVYAALWRWHVAGRPPGCGFEPADRSVSVGPHADVLDARHEG